MLLPVRHFGAIIAFENELNRTFHPQLTNVRPEGQPLDWDSVRARIEQQAPDWKLIRFYFPDQARSVHLRSPSVKYDPPYPSRLRQPIHRRHSWQHRTPSLVRLSRDLHYSVGFWSFLAMFAFSITGLALHYQTGKLLKLLNTPSAASQRARPRNFDRGDVENSARVARGKHDSAASAPRESPGSGLYLPAVS